ncbi:MAG: GIY-YIG nuclease family protein [bacterium]|nr:GIY-YIG nuclease family protein [bacterium]
MKYYFYILRCSDNSLYCVQTNNLERRIYEHSFDKNKSAKYLRGKTPVTLVYNEEYTTLLEAMKREWQIKKWTKSKKEAHIKQDLKLLKKL